MSRIEILRCGKCLKYTLKHTCNSCLTKTESPRPAKYSPHDPYGKWRLKYKLKENGI